MTESALIVSVNDRDPSLPVLGTKIWVLASNAATGGQEFTFQEGEEGTGPPPHCHPWDEAFFVLEGSVFFGIGEDRIECEPGTLVNVPAGTVHSFSYGPNGGKLFEISGRGTCASALFEDLAKEIPPGPPDAAKVGEVFNRHGATLLV